MLFPPLYSFLHMISNPNNIGLFGKWDGLLEIQGLADANIQRELKRRVNDVIVVAGGFEEASLGSYERNRICRQTWPYWVKRCLQNGYDMTFMWVYGGTQVYNQPEAGRDTRWLFAKRAIPAIIPAGPMGVPLVPLRVPLRCMQVKLELPTIAEPSAEEVEYWTSQLEAKATALLLEHPTPPGLGLAPIEPFLPWAATAKL